jgi:hypothetical protein
MSRSKNLAQTVVLVPLIDVQNNRAVTNLESFMQQVNKLIPQANVQVQLQPQPIPTSVVPQTEPVEPTRRYYEAPSNLAGEILPTRTDEAEPATVAIPTPPTAAENPLISDYPPLPDSGQRLITDYFPTPPPTGVTTTAEPPVFPTRQGKKRRRDTSEDTSGVVQEPAPKRMTRSRARIAQSPYIGSGKGLWLI